MACEDANEAVGAAGEALAAAEERLAAEEERAWARAETIKAECSGQSGYYQGTDKWTEGSVGACLGNVVYDWLNEDDLEAARDEFEEAQHQAADALMALDDCLAGCMSGEGGLWA